jgi:hypothetical protein
VKAGFFLMKKPLGCFVRSSNKRIIAEAFTEKLWLHGISAQGGFR